MEVSPECSLLIESVSKEQQAHEARFFAERIERVIRNYKLSVFVGAVADNTSSNKKARSVLSEMFQCAYFQG